jgi:hypothetical protein
VMMTFKCTTNNFCGLSAGVDAGKCGSIATDEFLHETHGLEARYESNFHVGQIMGLMLSDISHHRSVALISRTFGTLLKLVPYAEWGRHLGLIVVR